MLTAPARHILCLLAIAVMPLGAAAQSTSGERITLAASEPERVIEARLSGDQTAEYRVAAKQGQILSVDLDASRDSVYFNIKSNDGGEFLFAGMMAGNVADVALPETGDYLVQVFLVRAAARRDEQASYTLTIGVGEAGEAPTAEANRDSAKPAGTHRPEAMDGPKYWQVELEDATTRLNVRSGPGRQYAIAGQLANGETLENLGCRLSGADRWCHVRAAGSGLRGWAAGRFLVEGSQPSASSSSRGDTELEGLNSSDHDFDATGTVDCVLEPGQPAQRCPFGVIRDGPGNAGIWIAMPPGQDSKESLHILFETGMVTAINHGGDSGNGSNAGADYIARKIGDHYQIDTGMRQFAIPGAVVYGQKAKADDDEVDEETADDGGDAVDDSAGDDRAANDSQGSD
ncbi:SH3 domain-containing protein [Salinicola sp. CR57]|uniref:SH3 domain-containing protein n=1 Tax=Salinicola sp. CR57 TaxID=1949086 RepID=UPI000DA11E2F|nr:SH3 domain-containing protein [Salinicola sp. CR57]